MQSFLPERTTPSQIALIGLRAFYACLLVILCTSKPGGKKLFLSHHGRSHRLAALAHLSWLLCGVTSVLYADDPLRAGSWAVKCLVYDVVLGLLGIIATLSAARDFPHKRVVNRPGESGTLSNAAIVTQSEMIEHSFYQGLNLWQALYLHIITWAGIGEQTSISWRFVALWLVTCPWMLRRKFPINSFSANWAKDKIREAKISQEVKCIRSGHNRVNNLTSLNRFYQIKKWQYVFYKHVILHGLNISMALPNQQANKAALPLTFEWRIFWLCLNSSYVMEFFMQSLVKRCVLSQPIMLVLQCILMASSSFAAIGAVLWRVRYDVSLLSLVLNFIHRGHDVFNTCITWSLSTFIESSMFS